MKLDKPPRTDLPPKRALILGSGRCGTFHIAKMFNILFSEYVYVTHEQHPTYATSVSEIYDNWEFTSNKTLELARAKWRVLMGRWHTEDSPIHRWADSSAFNVPFVYHLGLQDPDLLIIVMIRHPEGFVRSCNAMKYEVPFSKRIPPGFIWDRQNHPRWKENYALYWEECYVALGQQLVWLGKDPDLVMFLDAYQEGKYVKRLLRLFDIPETQQNIEQTTWFCKTRAPNFSKNREVWKATEIPDLEDCKKVWDYWEENYAWMAEKK